MTIPDTATSPHYPRPYTPNAIINRVSKKLGGQQAKELERFIKFFIVGAIGFVVDFGTVNILQATILPPTSDALVVLASTISFTAAISSNFVWNRYWTYPDSRSRPIGQQVAQFFLVNFAGLILFRVGIVALLYGPFGGIGADLLNGIAADTVTTLESQNQLGTNLAQALAVLVVMFWNFFVNRYWTYNDVD